MVTGLFLTLVLVLLYAVVQADVAQAEPRIKPDCEIYDTNRVDPIASSSHLHRQFGNTTTTNESTAGRLLANRKTSCKDDWYTSAGWFPVERYEPVTRVSVYYRAPGNQKQVRAIPKGLQLLAVEQMYSCNEGPFQDTPVYGCRGNFATRVIFPDCWNRQSLKETTTVSSNFRGVCPRTHPYRIPKINYLIQHDNADGQVAKPLAVSAGVDAWEPWAHMHADYFAANQPVFNNKLIDLCLRNAPDSATPETQPDRCGKGVDE
jgi:hypothetical protein